MSEFGPLRSRRVKVTDSGETSVEQHPTGMTLRTWVGRVTGSQGSPDLRGRVSRLFVWKKY